LTAADSYDKLDTFHHPALPVSQLVCIQVETAHALFYYHERGIVPAPPSQQQVAAMRALTNGSGEELRRWSVKITQTNMGLL
jgi:hypothetical protein